VVGARGDVKGHGVGRQLFEGLAAWAKRHGIRDVRTQAAWNDHGMVRWLHAMGFALAPTHVVDCAWPRPYNRSATTGDDPRGPACAKPTTAAIRQPFRATGARPR
jgi:GNAT superfamily N-acetyltransferase